MCKDYEEMASLFIDGMLDESLKIDFLDHISHCDSCKNYFDTLSLIIDDVNSMEEIDPPIDLHKNIMDSIKLIMPEPSYEVEDLNTINTLPLDNNDTINSKNEPVKKAKIIDFNKFSKNKYAVASVLLVALVSAPILNSINLFELNNSNDKVTVMASELQDKGKILGKDEIVETTVTLVIKKSQNDDGVSYKILDDIGDKADITSAQNTEKGMVITATVPLVDSVDFANSIINSYDQVTYSVKKESISDVIKKIEDDITLNNELKSLFLEIMNDDANKDIEEQIKEKVLSIDEEITSLNDAKDDLLNNYEKVNFQIFII